MFKIFDTIEEFNAKNAEINQFLGLPTADGSTQTYASPIVTVDGRFAMQVLDLVLHLFESQELVENI